MQQPFLRASVILLLVVTVVATAAYVFVSDDDNIGTGPATGRPFADALLQNLGEQEGCEPRDGDGNIDWEAEFPPGCHNHRNYTHHQLSTPNVELVGFDPNLGNAEIQVAEAPDAISSRRIRGDGPSFKYRTKSAPTHARQKEE